MNTWNQFSSSIPPNSLTNTALMFGNAPTTNQFNSYSFNQPTQNAVQLVGSREKIDSIVKYILTSTNNYFELPLKNEINDQRFYELNQPCQQAIRAVDQTISKAKATKNSIHQKLEKLKDGLNQKDLLIFQSMELQSLKFRISSIIMQIEAEEADEIELDKCYIEVYNNAMLLKEGQLKYVPTDFFKTFRKKLEDQLMKIKSTLIEIQEITKLDQASMPDSNSILPMVMENLLIRMGNLSDHQKEIKDKLDRLKFVIVELLMKITGSNSQAVESSIKMQQNQMHSSNLNSLMSIK